VHAARGALRRSRDRGRAGRHRAALSAPRRLPRAASRLRARAPLRNGLAVLSPLEFGALAAAVLGAGAATALWRPGWIVASPRTVRAVLGLLPLAFAAIMTRPAPLGSRIGIDASSEPLLPENDPGEPVYQRAILDFGDDDIFVVAMESDDVFS